MIDPFYGWIIFGAIIGYLWHKDKQNKQKEQEVKKYEQL